MAGPAIYGFTNVTDPACGSTSSVLFTRAVYKPGNDQNYLFADKVHPTTAGQNSSETMYLEFLPRRAPFRCSPKQQCKCASNDPRLMRSIMFSTSRLPAVKQHQETTKQNISCMARQRKPLR
jgi:hypothetical protein